MNRSKKLLNLIIIIEDAKMTLTDIADEAITDVRRDTLESAVMDLAEAIGKMESVRGAMTGC